MDEIDKLADAEIAEATEGEISMQLSMHELVIQGANLRVARNEEDGSRALIVGPLLLTVVLPMSKEASGAIARELTGGIEIASGLPGGLKAVT